jgi:iron complex outermembrane receptor protein
MKGEELIMNVSKLLKCSASGMTLAIALSAAPAFGQTVPTTPPPPDTSPTATETRPATAGDQAPQDAQNPVEQVQTALPGVAAQTDAPTPEIVVTGTSIRGVAPVGSNLISVGRDTIEDTAVQSVQQLLKTVPAVVGLGSAGQGSFGSADASGTNAPTIHGLGASASNSTLILIDSHRFPLTGLNHALGDPNIIPPIALQRVEVLPDGSSSVYGSDAVAGVINFITRSHFNGVEAQAQTGFGDDYRTWQVGALAGTTWDSGWFVVAGNISHRDALAYSSRDFLAANHIDRAREAGLDLDQAGAAGRANRGGFFCDPATVQVGGNIYTYSGGSFGSPVVNTQENAFCDTNQYADLIPDEMRHQLMTKVSQDIGDRLTVGLDLVYSNRKNVGRDNRGTVQATMFGPGSTPPGGADQINPFFVPFPGATQYTVRWSADELLGPGAQTEAGARTWYAYGHADYRISDAWRLNFGAVTGHDHSYSYSTGQLCGSCAILALNGTTSQTGSVTAPSVPGTDLIVTNLPLTTDNALDLFGGNTSSDLLRVLGSDSQTQDTQQGFRQFRGQLNGDLFALPGGTAKVALGAEYMDYTIHQNRIRSRNIGPSSDYSTQLNLDYDRNVKSGFAELFLPLIGPEQGIPGVRSLDVDVSGRYDEYSDFGDTFNPKIGANWEVIEGVRFRGSWAKSFVAPALTSRGVDEFGTTAETSVANGGFIAVPIANYPDVVNIPGVVCSATTCNIGTGNIRGIQLNGGSASLKPQKGRTWSLGVDILPSLFRGLHLSATYWHNSIKGAITAPVASFAVLGDPGRLQIFPGGLSPTSPELLQIIGTRPVNITLPSTIYYAYDFTQGNVLNLVAEGIDADARYIYSAPWGSIEAGASISYKTKFDQSFGTGPSFSVLNTTGFNTTFPSIRTEARADLGFKYGGLSATLFANYTGSYRNWSTLSLTPVERSDEGLPIGGGDKVKASTIFDLHVNYELPSFTILPKASVYLDVQNLFDKEPPFYSSANGYDTYGGNPIGRVITIGIRSLWGGSSALPPPLPAAVAPPPPVEAPPATQTCADGTVVLATQMCPAAPPPPVSPPPAPERG